MQASVDTWVFISFFSFMAYGILDFTMKIKLSPLVEEVQNLPVRLLEVWFLSFTLLNYRAILCVYSDRVQLFIFWDITHRLLCPLRFSS